MYILKQLFFSISVNSGFRKMYLATSRHGKYLATIHLDFKELLLNVCKFYPSISEHLLGKALDYLAKFTTITPEDRQIIMHAKKSLLYHGKNQYDVTMGSYDKAETCELIGTLILAITNRSEA